MTLGHSHIENPDHLAGGSICSLSGLNAALLTYALSSNGSGSTCSLGRGLSSGGNAFGSRVLHFLCSLNLLEM